MAKLYDSCPHSLTNMELFAMFGVTPTSKLTHFRSVQLGLIASPSPHHAFSCVTASRARAMHSLRSWRGLRAVCLAWDCTSKQLLCAMIGWCNS